MHQGQHAHRNRIGVQIDLDLGGDGLDRLRQAPIKVVAQGRPTPVVRKYTQEGKVAAGERRQIRSVAELFVGRFLANMVHANQLNSLLKLGRS